MYIRNECKHRFGGCNFSLRKLTFRSKNSLITLKFFELTSHELVKLLPELEFKFRFKVGGGSFEGLKTTVALKPLRNQILSHFLHPPFLPNLKFNKSQILHF